MSWIKVKKVKPYRGTPCFRVLDASPSKDWMIGRKYTVNDLRVIRSYEDLKIKRVR